MRIKDIIRNTPSTDNGAAGRDSALSGGVFSPDAVTVDAGSHVLELVEPLAQAYPDMPVAMSPEASPSRPDMEAFLEALAELLPRRADCSVIEVECPRRDYSASAIAMAVEDAGTEVTDIISRSHPEKAGYVSVTLRVGTLDTTAAEHSLSRHGYSVTDSTAPARSDMQTAMERLSLLHTLLNI